MAWTLYTRAMSIWFGKRLVIRQLVVATIVSILAFGSVFCNSPVHQMFAETHTANCSVTTLFSNTVISTEEYLTLTLGFFVLLTIALALASLILAVMEERQRLWAWFFRLHNLGVPLQNYLLRAFQQGILHSRAY